MTDARLTATNPETSELVPVACNAKGELILDTPEDVLADYIPATGGHFTGKVTFAGAESSPYVTFNSNGQSVFKNIVKIEADPITGGALLKVGFGDSRGTINMVHHGSGEMAIDLKSDGGSSTDNIQIISDGTINLNKELTLGSVSGGGGGGVRLIQGKTLVYTNSSYQNAWEGWNAVNGSPALTSYIRGDGYAVFRNELALKSNSKMWKVVESNGVAHLSTVSAREDGTIDFDQPTPPVRDLPAELDRLASLPDDVAQLRAELQKLAKKLDKGQ